MTDIASHRGGALLWPENSRIAFEQTAKLPVEQVEFDVHPTRDGKLVVIHDDTLDRTTDGAGPVAARDWAELQRFTLKGTGGQRMLLQACAGFMIPGVKVHVLDEPFAGINPVVKDTLIELILKENKTGATFLIVSHEMDIIRRICPRVTVMIAGKVAAEGALEEIARREDVVTAYLGRSLQ